MRHEGYEVTTETVDIGARRWTLRCLLNRSQFHDPDGIAAKMGVHENVWPLFGLLWPAAASLCKALAQVDFRDERVLELGCGLGLVSLMLHERGVDVLASDIHPLAERFLRDNAALNQLSEVPFARLDWTQRYPQLQPFSAFVASDVLYEDGMASDIADFIAAHAAASSRVFMVDPGRAGRRNRFTRAMEAHGFTTDEWQPDPDSSFRIMTYERTTAPDTA